jgi:hypothetical protein
VSLNVGNNCLLLVLLKVSGWLVELNHRNRSGLVFRNKPVVFGEVEQTLTGKKLSFFLSK